MGVVGNLIGMITSGIVAAAGKASYESNRRKKTRQLNEEFNRKNNAEGEQVRILCSAVPQDDSEALQKEIERRIGCLLEVAGRQKRSYNLPMEYEVAIDRLRAMHEQFLKEHPPGSVLRIVRRSLQSTDPDRRGVATDYVAAVSDMKLPEDQIQWKACIEEEFWRQECASFVGPGWNGGRKTYGVSTGLYALGQARIDVAAAGFLPSNCMSNLWPYWNPYISWDGKYGVMSNRFKSRVDLCSMVPCALYTHMLTKGTYPSSFAVEDKTVLVRRKQEEYERNREWWAMFDQT